MNSIYTQKKDIYDNKNDLSNFFLSIDNIQNKNIKTKIEEMFICGKIQDLSYHEIMGYLEDISNYNPSYNESIIIQNIFKNFGQYHYYNREYGFLILLGILNLYSKKQHRKYKTYLLKNTLTGHFKIGKTSKNNIQDRVKQLSVGAEIDIVSFTDIDIEHYLHKKYENKRVHREWFNLDDEDIKDIQMYFTNKLLDEVRNAMV